MANIKITTHPTGRSPENKYFFGERTRCLDLSRPKYNKIGKEEDFESFYKILKEFNYDHILNFETVGTNFTIHTNDERHRQFVWNMFKVVDEDQVGDWTIYHLSLIHI